MQNAKQSPVLIDGEWRQAKFEGLFQAHNPNNGELLPQQFPVSSWDDCDAALNAATAAHEELSRRPAAQVRQSIVDFLLNYANAIEANSQVLVEIAHLETGLARSPRLADAELPRTCTQLRLAAQAALTASWCEPIIDTQHNIRSILQSIGPVIVFGPNNFPFAFGSISGGDFVSAIAAGNPVIAKAHPSHPATTKLFAELAADALRKTDLPSAMLQLIYAVNNDNGLKLVADPRVAATGFTGSRRAGIALKNAAEQAGKLIYVELSSVNPVVVLQGAAKQSADKIAAEFTNSCLAAAGQLCTKPGLLIIPEGASGDHLVGLITEKFKLGAVANLLSPYAAEQMSSAIQRLVSAGATLLVESILSDSEHSATGRFCHANTLLSVSGSEFLANSQQLQHEVFGNASVIVRVSDTQQLIQLIECFEGNLTGCIYSHSGDVDDAVYVQIEPLLRQRVGRIINDKMPTGVQISSAMNHGGPFPSSGHPGFSAVGFPGAIKRFTALKCFDGVRHARLPDLLQDHNPQPLLWRCIDGHWTQADLAKVK